MKLLKSDCRFQKSEQQFPIISSSFEITVADYISSVSHNRPLIMILKSSIKRFNSY